MGNLWQDVRYGVRMLLKSPGISIVATIALALGIGANTAIFSVVNAVLLRPLAFPDSDRLEMVWETDQTRGVRHGSFSYPNFFDVRSQNQSFEHLSCYHDADYIMTGRGDATRVRGLVVTADLFPVLGVSPILGRWFVPDEDKPGDSGHVAILSQSFFERHFNSDPSVLNHTITLDGHDYTVVGVMPRSFEFPVQNEPVELWTTISEDASGSSPMTGQRGAHFLNVIGRLKGGVNPVQAQADLTTIASRLEQQYPDTNTHKGVSLQSALESLVGDVRPALLILLGAVACVLLIACANVANLLLARAMTRHKEIAIRCALGAGRGRIIRQLLTESVLLSLTGGLLGLLLAVWWSDLLVALGKQEIPRALQVGLDWRVLAFTLVISIMTGILFGLAPALKSSGSVLTESLKEGRGAGAGAGRNLMRSILVVVELVCAVVLLLFAGLLIKSLSRLRSVNPGLATQNVLTFNVALSEVRYNSEKQARFFHDLAGRLAALPGVQSTSSTMPLPLSGDRFSISFAIDGRPVAKKDEPSADFFSVGSGYFRTMGIPIIKGRDFNDRDQHTSNPVIIVTESFARRYFPGEEPIGKRIKPGISTYDNEKSTMREIVGVVGDVRNLNLSTAEKPAFYEPQTQTPFNQMILVVKTTADPHSLETAATREVQAMDRDLPVFGVKTMDEYVATTMAAPRFITTLLSIFASVALALTVVGLYGVMSYAVAQRTNEFGVRIALGAQVGDIVRLVLKHGLIVVLIGVAIGIGAALLLTSIMTKFLYGVGANDPLTFVVIPVVLGAVTLLACYLPARRATKVDPLVALRAE